MGVEFFLEKGTKCANCKKKTFDPMKKNSYGDLVCQDCYYGNGDMNERKIRKIETRFTDFSIGDFIGGEQIYSIEDRSIETTDGSIDRLYLLKNSSGDTIISLEDPSDVVVYYTKEKPKRSFWERIKKARE